MSLANTLVRALEAVVNLVAISKPRPPKVKRRGAGLSLRQRLALKRQREKNDD